MIVYTSFVQALRRESQPSEREFSQNLVATSDYPLRSDVTPANGLRLDKLAYRRVTLEEQEKGIPDVVARWRTTFGV